jgi:phage shock protein PspC (stress-responsive transcriptional regulator)
MLNYKKFKANVIMIIFYIIILLIYPIETDNMEMFYKA